jgi:hypothetical protein
MRCLHVRDVAAISDTPHSYIPIPTVTLVYSEQDWPRPAVREQVASLRGDVETITLPDTGHFLRSGTLNRCGADSAATSHHVESTA